MISRHTDLCRRMALVVAGNAMGCFLCPSPSEGSCFWPVQKYVEAEIQELEVGELLESHPSHKPKFKARVLGLSGVHDGMLSLYLRVGCPEETRQTVDRRVDVNDFMRVMVLRDAACGNPACEVHSVERGEGLVICSTHWNSWEQAA